MTSRRSSLVIHNLKNQRRSIDIDNIQYWYHHFTSVQSVHTHTSYQDISNQNETNKVIYINTCFNEDLQLSSTHNQIQITNITFLLLFFFLPLFFYHRFSNRYCYGYLLVGLPQEDGCYQRKLLCCFSWKEEAWRFYLSFFSSILLFEIRMLIDAPFIIINYSL